MSSQLLSQIRDSLSDAGLDGLYLGRSDKFQGEEVRPCDEYLAWLTGFTGSAGAAVVLSEQAAVFSDGRYILQMANQLDSALFDAVDIIETSPISWLAGKLPSGKIGYDGWQVTKTAYDRMVATAPNIEFVALEPEFLSCHWQDRPAETQAPIWRPDPKICGQDSSEKLQQIADELASKQADFALVTSAETVNWMLNIRGRDLEHTPFHLCYALVSTSGEVTLIGADSAAGYHNFGFDQLDQLLASTSNSNGAPAILADPDSLCMTLYSALMAAGIQLTFREEPLIYAKAIKNRAELQGFEQAHIKDGVAMVRFSHWLKTDEARRQMTEADIASQLVSFRGQDAEYICDSFATIAGFNANGAIVHYRAEKGADAPLSGDGVLLVDSGAHYQMGTTDITRTFALGSVSADAVKAASLVLAAHAELARCIFPEGTNGVQLDAIARQPLWQYGFDYGHGTGHGVGHILGVHEGPASISKRGTKPIKVGYILSNEPGYYKAGSFGIRQENLVKIVQAKTGYLGMESLTLCPFDRDLIDISLFTDDQRDWLNSYHRHVYEVLAPYLDDTLRQWLSEQTASL